MMHTPMKPLVGPMLWLVGALALLWAVGPASADTIELNNNLVYREARINGIQGDKLSFSTNAADLEKPMADIRRIAVEGETVLNNAEVAFVSGEWEQATSGYEKTAGSTQKAWLKDWCAMRLMESARRGGRFDVTIKTLIDLAEKSPDAAAATTLVMPAAQSTYLTEAIRLVEAATRKPKQKDKTNEVLLKVLGDLYLAKKDLKGKADADERLLQLRAKMDPNSPAAQRAALAVKLDKLRDALARKQYDAVIQVVNAEAPNIIDSADQAEALFCLAEAMAGKAASSTDADTWKAVAVAYMRVAANAPAASPRTPEALLKTAEICAKRLGDRQAARQIYKQVREEYKGQPSAKEAEKAEAALP